MIAKTKNQSLINFIQSIIDFYGIKITYDGNFKWLGAFYGLDDFINDKMIKKLKDLLIKLEHIFLIGNTFIRHNLIRKFYTFNKIIYWLKIMPRLNKWMNVLDKIHNLMKDRIIPSVNMIPTLQHQIPMSQKRGGFGLRDPRSYQYAAKISSLREKEEVCQRYFMFTSYSFNFDSFIDDKNQIQNIAARMGATDCIDNFIINPIENQMEQLKIKVRNGDNQFVHTENQLKALQIDYNLLRNKINDSNWFVADNNTVELYNDYLEKALDKHNEKLKYNIDKFNLFIGPNLVFKIENYKSHNNLLELMDKKHLALFELNAQQSDMARIKSLSNNGSMSWLNVMYKWAVPRQLSNQQMFVALSLVCGLPMLSMNGKFCNYCNKNLDIFGHHCLSCIDTGLVYERHDKICNILADYLVEAGYQIQMEARYHIVDGIKCRRLQRPGDIKVLNWYFQEQEITGSMYFDVSVGNLFCKSHVKGASNNRLYLADKLEKFKDNKYGNRDDIQGLGLECMGGMSRKFVSLIQTIAEALEGRTEIARSIWMHKIRSRIIMELMYQNVKMVQACCNIGMVHDDFDENDDDYDI